jgi:hypothetical protein
LRVRVAFDGIVRPDSPQVFLPTDVLAVDLTQIGYEEGIFFSYATGILINTFNTILQSITNQLFCVMEAMVVWKDKIATH